MGQLICLDMSVFRKISFKITSIQGHNYQYRERLFVALCDSSLILGLDDELYNQPARLLKTNFLVVIILAAISLIPKYTKETYNKFFRLF